MQVDTPTERESKEQLRRLRAAALSVHLHVGPTRTALPLLGRNIKPLSLGEAVAELARGSGPEARRLRARASATLLRAQTLSPDTRDGFVASCARARELLGAEEPPAAGPPLSEGLAPASRQAEHESRADRGETCRVIDEQVRADFDPHTFVTTITVTARVNRPPSTMAVSSDPKNWSKIAHDSFLESYRVDEDERGRPKADGPYRYVPSSDTATGKSWKGYLFENVEFSWDGFELTTFRNLINIRYEATDSKIDMRFWLYRAIDCTVGVRRLDGGLDVDSGYFTAVPDPDDPKWTRIAAEKRVRFRDLTPDDSVFMEPGGAGQFLNFMSPAIVGIFMDQFVSEGSCMHPGS